MRVKLATLVLALPGCCLAQTPQAADILDMSLGDLLNLEITSASRSAERVTDAPATVIVLTRDELLKRGYRELSEIYDDLPGMDLSRAYGDTYYRNQWRGLRKSIGTPYLLMLDGVILNHLYFNQEEIITTLPLSSIEQVEVVYGPASAVYGPNAFVGVINVITRKDAAEDGHHLDSRISAGSFNTRVADFQYLYKAGDWRASVAGRFDDGDIDTGQSDSYEWTRPEYQQDSSLWGAFTNRSGFNGNGSPHHNRSLDLRLFHGETELAVQYFTLNTHFGNVYPGDRILRLSAWNEPELSIYLRTPVRFGTKWSGTALFRYRESGVDTDSNDLDSFDGTDPDTGETVRLVRLSRWAAQNSSWAANLDMEYRHSERLSLLTGVKAEAKDLQKAYRITFGPSIPADQLLQPDDYPDPPRPDFDSIPNNRINTLDMGVYALAKFNAGSWWGWGENHALLAGVRYDDNSEYGTTRTLRGGYVLSRAPWTAKLLYGEAFNEPAPRELYGGWTGSGSNPSLKPETANTLEASLNFQQDAYSITVSAYRLHSDNNITTFSGGASNLGDRNIRGIDAHFNARLPIGERAWTFWAYYSYIKADESVPLTIDELISQPVGDTSPDKLHIGLTWPVTETFSATLRGRYIGARDTVVTNPIGKVSSFATFDLTLLKQQWPRPGLGWSLSVLNLANRTYFHPGLREGDAGTSPGLRDSNGVWHGSAGFFNSLLPQQGRSLFLSLLVGF